MGTSTQQPAGSADRGFFMPTKWWQWVLVYPALATTLFSASGPIIDKVTSLLDGVPNIIVNDGQRQNDFWARNAECPYANPYTSLVKKDTLQIDATICNTGDVVLRRSNAGGESAFRFVSWSGPTKVVAASGWSDLLPMASAFAQSPAIVPRPAGEPVVLCQRKVDAKTLLTRLKFAPGCFDEKVNTYTGQLLDRQSVPCVASC